MWHLTVNTNKTKIVIFSKGKVKKYPVFRFGDTEIDVISDYVYLGTTFNFNNSFNKAICKQVNQARRAMFSLIAKAKRFSLPIDLQLELFNQLVAPILLYGSEVWGFSNMAHINSFYLKFCKQLLRVNASTANCMVYGELGTCSLSKSIENRMVNFWASIVHGKSHKLTNTVYRLLKVMYDTGVYKSPWMCKIKTILDSSGMSNLWHIGTNFNKTWLKNAMQLRLSDIYAQNTMIEIQENSHCVNYRIFKKSPTLENYRIHLDPYDRINLCRFRCGNHSLPIVTGRYQNVAREARYCDLCPGNHIGDEFHYILECSFFINERKKYIKRHYYLRPNVFKMDMLFNTNNVKELSNLAKFCHHVMLKFKT